MAPPSALLLCHLSASKRLWPLAEGEGHSPRPSSSALHQPVGAWSKGMANGVSNELWVEQAGSGHFWQWWRAMLGDSEASAHSAVSGTLILNLRKLPRG